MDTGVTVGGRYVGRERVPDTGTRVLWTAVDEWSRRTVVLASVPVSRFDDVRRAAVRRAVGHEVRTASSLRHPHLDPAGDVVADDRGDLWVVGDVAVAPATVRRRVRTDGSPSASRIARWGRDVADGLAALHDAGLAHCAVGAELVAADGDGPARLLAVAATADLTGPWGGGGDGTDADVRDLVTMLRGLLDGRTSDPAGAALAAALDEAGQDTAARLRDHLAVVAERHPDRGGPAASPVAAPSVPGPSVAAPSVPAPSIAGPSVPGPSVPGRSVAGPSVPGPAVPGPSVPGPSVSGPQAPAGGGRDATVDLRRLIGTGGGPDSAVAHGPAGTRVYESGAAASGAAGSGGASGAAAGPTTSGPAASGAAGPGAAAFGPAASGPAAPSPAVSGPAWSGPAPFSPAASSPAGSGPAGFGAAAGGPAPSGPAASGPAGSGPAASGPAWSGPAGSWPPGTPGRPPGPPAAPSAGRRRGRIGLVIGAVAVVVLIGIVAVLAGTGVAGRLVASGDGGTGATGGTGGTAPPPAPATAVGDQRTADPCGLLAEAAMRRYGRTVLVPDYGSPAGCGIQIEGGGPGYLSVSATFARRDLTSPPEGTPTPSGALTVFREATEPESCTRTIVLPDDTLVVVLGEAWEGAKGDLCAVAEAGVSTAVSALSGGELPRRTTTDPPTALTALDICSVADATVVARGTGIDTTRRQDGFAGWGCYWGEDAAFDYAPTVGIDVRRFASLTGTPTTIAGRRAQVVPSPTPGSTVCTASLVQRTYTLPNGSSRVEVLAIRAYAGPEKDSTASCASARAIAEAVAPRLPAAS